MSQPDRRRGRGRQSSPSPVARAAQAAGLPLLRPERVGAPECVAALKAHTPDLGVVVAFGQFLPRKIRELPSLGYLINAHASQLPRHRGAAPIAHAILAGDTRTAVSVMRVEREMDAGPVCLVCETPIADDDNVGSLTERLGEIAAEAIAAAVDQIAAGTVLWTAQDHANATLAPKIGRHDARLDFRIDEKSVPTPADAVVSTLDLRGLTLHEVLEAVLTPLGLDYFYIQQEDYVLIATPEKARPQ